jgi:leader peptidase (prepilin peptidase)/N-methyltransferase
VAYITFEIFALVFGLCIGSFMNVCIARMPEDRSVVAPASACPSCNTTIRPIDNIPVLSWLILRGRCRNCSVSISPLYPTIELIVGLITLLVFRLIVPEITLITVQALGVWVFYSIFLSMLVGLSYIDLKHYIIPDQFSIYAAPFGVAGCFLLPMLDGNISSIVIPTWQDSAIGAVAGAGVLLAVIGVYWLIRREEGMGMGDVKLLGMIGAFLGWQAIAPVIFAASIIGSLVGIALMISAGRGFRSQVPFGPFLAIASVIYLFFGQPLVGLII